MKNEVAQKFRTSCYEVFSFVEKHGFVKKRFSRKWSNEFEVQYEKSGIKFVIEGINYGENILAYFVAENGEHVGLYDSNSIRQLAKKGYSQDEQISKAAIHLKQEWQSVLENDFTALNNRASILAKDRERRQKAFKEYISNPEAIAQRKAIVAVSEAGRHYKRKNYRKFVELLEPHEKYLPAKQMNKLKEARMHLTQNRKED